MKERSYICFHQDRLLGWAVFSYCLLLTVIHFVRLVMHMPLFVVPGISKHPVAVLFLLTLGILFARLQCIEERLLFVSVALAYGVVIVAAADPHLQATLGIWGRVLMVAFWAGATGFSIRILAATTRIG
jgi:hypothetical protein